MVMSNFSSSIKDPGQDGPKWLRIFWAILTAVLTIAMLVADGVTTMEYATLIFGLPVTIVAFLVMASFSKVLRMERAEREGRALRSRLTAASGGQVPEKTWRQRLANARSYPSKKSVAQFITRVAHPALIDVSAEFTKQGYNTKLNEIANTEIGVNGYALIIGMDEQRNFHYQVSVVEAPVPMFGGRMSRETDVYYRLEVFTQTGSEGYDLVGLSKQQVIEDVIDRFESHLSFLRHSTEVDAASVLTPPVSASQHPDVEIEREPGEAADSDGNRDGGEDRGERK